MSKPYTALVIAASTSVSVRLSQGEKKFRAAVIAGVNTTGKGTANTGTVYVGTDSDFTPLRVIAGKDVTIAAPPGVFYDLRDFWLAVDTANDGVAIFVTA